ncbi:MAG: DUF3870 domain-containing protein [Bacillota bacterium]
MDTYDKNTIYIVGDAKTSTTNPITLQYSAYYIALVIDADTERIVDVGVSATLPITSGFVRSVFLDYSMREGLEPMVEEIMRRYHGSSQKALIVAWKDAFKKYEQVKNGWKAK